MLCNIIYLTLSGLEQRFFPGTVFANSTLLYIIQIQQNLCQQYFRDGPDKFSRSFLIIFTTIPRFSFLLWWKHPCQDLHLKQRHHVSLCCCFCRLLKFAEVVGMTPTSKNVWNFLLTCYRERAHRGNISPMLQYVLVVCLHIKIGFLCITNNFLCINNSKLTKHQARKA